MLNRLVFIAILVKLGYLYAMSLPEICGTSTANYANVSLRLHSSPFARTMIILVFS